MSFTISATDTSGRLSLRRDTIEGALKKAAELQADACWDISVVGPDGRDYGADVGGDIGAGGTTAAPSAQGAASAA